MTEAAVAPKAAPAASPASPDLLSFDRDRDRGITRRRSIRPSFVRTVTHSSLFGPIIPWELLRLRSREELRLRLRAAELAR